MTALRGPGDERVAQIKDICDLIDTALESTAYVQSHGARSTVAFLKICGTLLAPQRQEFGSITPYHPCDACILPWHNICLTSRPCY